MGWNPNQCAFPFGVRMHAARLIVEFHREAEKIALQYGIPINKGKMILFLRTKSSFTKEEEQKYVEAIVNTTPQEDWSI